MKTIHKFPFHVSDITLDLQLPLHARPLCVQVQGDRPCLWVELDPLAAKHRTRFMVFGTGQPIPNHATWIATWQEPPYVWHLYDVACMP